MDSQDKYRRDWIMFSVSFAKEDFDLLYDDLMNFCDLRSPEIMSRVNFGKVFP